MTAHTLAFRANGRHRQRYRDEQDESYRAMYRRMAVATVGHGTLVEA
jgi:hypothetical protein